MSELVKTEVQVRDWRFSLEFDTCTAWVNGLPTFSFLEDKEEIAEEFNEAISNTISRFFHRPVLLSSNWEACVGGGYQCQLSDSDED